MNMQLSEKLESWVEANLSHECHPTAMTSVELDELAGRAYLEIGDGHCRELIGWYIAHRQYCVGRPLITCQRMRGVANRVSQFVRLRRAESPYAAITGE